MSAPKFSALLIDTDKLLLVKLRTLLEGSEFKVFTAESAQQGLEVLRQFRPDIIVCEIRLPPPDGFQFRRYLNQDPRLADIPFIFLTGIIGIKEKVAGLGLGADDYITKPFDDQEFLSRVKSLLRRVHRERQATRALLQNEVEQVRQSVSLNFSHEIRTPLNHILTTLEMIQAGQFDDRAEERKFVGLALQSAQMLQTLIEDLVLLGQLDRGQVDTTRMPVESEDIMKLVDKAVEPYNDRRLSVSTRIDPGVMLTAPVGPFRRALSHLVDNACKFSPKGGSVMVHLKANGLGGGLLTITNDGPTIPPEMREKVFERYFQVSQGTQRTFGGLGIGLSIARSVARMVGGDVKFVEVTDGCCVQMMLPPDRSLAGSRF
jgi:signal transduction histidine kinase